MTSGRRPTSQRAGCGSKTIRRRVRVACAKRPNLDRDNLSHWEPVDDAGLHLNEWCLATSSLLRCRKRAALL